MSGSYPLFRAGFAGGSGFTDLLTDIFTQITDPRSLVNLGRLDAADLGGGLADQILVRSLDRQKGLLLDIDRHTLGQVQDDWMAKAQGHAELSLFHGGTVTHALDLE